MENKIIEKIQKLLALSGSANENESKAAMVKAQELMAKHNIEMQSIENHDSEYIREKTDNYKRESVEEKYIASILCKYFFVSIVRTRKSGYSYLNIVGEKNNVKTAIHMRQYLTNTFKALWREYKIETGAAQKAKQSFYLGLFNGFCDKMKEQRAKTEEKYGLVLVNDTKIDDKVSSHG